MKKIVLALSLFFFTSVQFVHADEGMWLLSLIKKYNYEAMRVGGLQLTPEQIYDEQNPSLKDAIVWFNGGCTGEIVSSQGLVLTNHHCGYGAIANHSTVDHDYLNDGFWAASLKDELSNPGMFVSVLVRMEDVTAQVLQQCAGKEGQARDQAVAKISKDIVAKAIEGTHYNADVKEMFRGAEYYLFVFETFKDIRLVGAPPSSIGKFGGDTDNWMWPRHTGDFSLFRIYADKNNKPAEYSADNVPYKPKKYLNVSLKGFNKGDFSMIIGFPGRTNRYLTSYSIDITLKETYPALVGLWQKQLDIMKKYMDADPKVKIALASQYAGIANAYKLFGGQTSYGMADNLINIKQEEEKNFTAWANTLANDSLKNLYTKVLPALKKKYDEYRPNNLPSLYANRLLVLSSVSLANRFSSLYDVLKTEPVDVAKRDELITKLKQTAHDFFVNYIATEDKEVSTEWLLKFNKGVPKDKQGTFISDITLQYKKLSEEDALKQYIADIFAKSIFVSESKLNAFLSKPSYKILDKDPAYQFAVKITTFANQFPPLSSLANAVNTDSRIYLQGLRMMNASKSYYPDANSSIRLTYGKVIGYDPRDAVHYDFITTLTGVMQKENPSDEEFIVPAKLKELYLKKDFGPYAFNGDVPVAFITDNDITGGNSGSPVMNANGELIGIAFDGNSEAMTGDFNFNPSLKRTIAVDIRYVMFVIDKYAGATRLVNEMTLVK